MSYITENWYWIVAALGSGGALAWLQLKNGGGGGDLSAQDAVMLINREKATVLDVSDAAEFAAGHVRNARHVPLDQIAEGVKGLPSNKQLPLVVIDATGARGTKAVAKLKALGYEKAQALRGGLRAWREANLPIDKAN
ncbi:MAG: rhodanese-like domain-containing protein [Aquabacterium sp.]|jgi:rhodanese-related sulfurtransferase|uniref:rhodanese-like domain-containing protein n=1 Tax=Aquabacterium sp. TaxID=1872578 RepID=UPI003BB1F538